MEGKVKGANELQEGSRLTAGGKSCLRHHLLEEGVLAPSLDKDLSVSIHNKVCTTGVEDHVL